MLTGKTKKRYLDVFLPFHAAKQHSKERENDSAEYPARGYKLHDFPKRPLFASSTGKSRLRDQVNGCHFFRRLRCWFVFFAPLKQGINTLKGINASKENERI
jgi:hypothetical protein